MARILRWLVFVPTALFAFVTAAQGVMWLARPERAASSWGIVVPDGGLGLSSIVGAMTAYSLTISLCLVIGMIRRERIWFYPPMMLFFFLAIGRITAGLVHGAPLEPSRFVVEFVITGLIFLASHFGTQKS